MKPTHVHRLYGPIRVVSLWQTSIHLVGWRDQSAKARIIDSEGRASRAISVWKKDCTEIEGPDSSREEHLDCAGCRTETLHVEDAEIENWFICLKCGEGKHV